MPEVCGLPVVPFEELKTSHPPRDFDAFIALGYGGLNRNRGSSFTVSRRPVTSRVLRQF